MDQLDVVLSQMRDEYSPDVGARDRVRAALAVAVAASVVSGAATTKTAVAAVGTGAGAAAPAGVGAAAPTGAGALSTAGALGVGGAVKGAIATFTWGKLVASAGVVAVLTATGAYGVQHGLRPAAQQSSAAPVVPAVAPRFTPIAPSDRAEPVEAEPAHVLPAASEEMAREPARVAAPERRHRATAERTSDTPKAQTSTMLEELRLLRQASQQLRAGQSLAAQRSLEEHRRRFPKSFLSDERRGLSLIAACASGNTPQNRARAERFVQASPASPLADSVRKRCLE